MDVLLKMCQESEEHQEISESDKNENGIMKAHKTGHVKCKQEIKRVKKQFKIPCNGCSC